MNKNNKLRKIAAKINQFRCTITYTPAVLLHTPAARCGTITQATGAEINAIKLEMEKSAVLLHTSPARAQELSKEFLERARQRPVEIQYNTEYGQINEPAVPLHSHAHDGITEYCLGDIKLAMMLHNLTHVRRYRKWWQIWKPRSWIEPRDSAVPLHIHGGNYDGDV